MALLTGSQIIINLLRQNGIDVVFGLPGGMILPLYNELFVSNFKHVLVRQEQAAGFMAQGVARVTGKAAVCMATSGPGAMNLLTAVADARSDSIPLVAFTGQVNTNLIGTDAFQEADTFGLSFPITKHSVMVKSAKELLTAVPLAFAIAESGRPGPVLIDVPRNVQTELCEVPSDFDTSFKRIYNEYVSHAVRNKTKDSEMPSVVDNIVASLAKAKNPILYVGGGCNSPEAGEKIAEFLKIYDIPVISSLMGLGVVPRSCPSFLGMVGMHGTFTAGKAAYDSDLVIAAGSRFDDRAAGVPDGFCPKAKIIHIDIDAAEINKILPSYINFVGSTIDAFSQINSSLKKADLSEFKNERAKWLSSCIELKNQEKIQLEMSCAAADCCGAKTCGKKGGANYRNPREFIASLPSGNDIIVTTDVGQHQMWAAQYFDVQRPRQFLTSGSLGTMGFGLPAALGAAFAEPDKRIVCISGDGSILMNIQELATMAENNLNVTVIVLENGALGMVRQQQEYLFDKHYSASTFASNPDLLKIAEGFGIRSVDADAEPDWQKKAFDVKGPVFVRTKIARCENVLPFVKGGSLNIDSLR
ncbi:MAG: biosynthetic-type acetolactate synthase large subunit [Treponema sp.]|uniref:biosynthetic-type acetolactate synthase large subunit n=1 Tax=Treponema sp. TaxID=166 RepID=UPI0025F31735|nr:biosynthetic-type acetolactate synthase large subunit [Treponema sp.]MBQ8680537.1 biosynthetic-type acetolactate synthase large subunit [Treponema sp.]